MTKALSWWNSLRIFFLINFAIFLYNCLWTNPNFFKFICWLLFSAEFGHMFREQGNNNQNNKVLAWIFRRIKKAASCELSERRIEDNKGSLPGSSLAGRSRRVFLPFRLLWAINTTPEEALRRKTLWIVNDQMLRPVQDVPCLSFSQTIEATLSVRSASWYPYWKRRLKD